MTTISLNTKLYKYICEMFLDDVPVLDIAKHFGLKPKSVKQVLTEHFGKNWRSQRPNQRRSSAMIIPKITEPDLFTCQLALIANIGRKQFDDFVKTVRQHYPDTYNGVDTKTTKFRVTPDIDNEELDLENPHPLYPLIHVWKYRNLT